MTDDLSLDLDTVAAQTAHDPTPASDRCPDCGGRGWELVDRLGRRWRDDSPCPEEPSPRAAECPTCDGRGCVAAEASVAACEEAYASLDPDALEAAA